ncbi:MAG: hypothetical protein Q8P20_08385 [bacterium]|nr:hypothetical protein [bacterium]
MIKNKLRLVKKLTIIILLILLTSPSAVLGATFDQNSILTDNELVNYQSMSISRIQNFLNSKGALGAVSITDPWGTEKTAAQIIYDAAQYWQISPQYLLVRMQIEQSLVTDPTISQRQLDWATGYGVCDSCSTSDPNVIKYKGLWNQVNWGARKIRESYLSDLETRGYTISGWGPGITKIVNDYNGTYSVTPVNDATAAMYTYTPHVYNANYNLWYYTNEWFQKNYPDGTLLQVSGEAGVWLIQNGKKRPFHSKTALVSRFDVSKIIQVSKSNIDAYDFGPPIRFQNYSLLKSIESGRVYLIDGDNKRYIESPEVFRNIGFNPEEIIEVPNSELNDYGDGININNNSIHPTGVLLQSKETGGISYVENGVRHSIYSPQILQSQFSRRVPVTVEQSTIDSYSRGADIKFKDGELITSPEYRSVFVISNGQRRPIDSADTFNSLGYRWDQIIHTTDKSVSLHPLGDFITIEL